MYCSIIYIAFIISSWSSPLHMLHNSVMIPTHSYSIRHICILCACYAFALLLSSFLFGDLLAVLLIYVTPVFLYAHTISTLYFMSSVHCPPSGPVFHFYFTTLFPLVTLKHFPTKKK
jgi:hypothetical protein